MLRAVLAALLGMASCAATALAQQGEVPVVGGGAAPTRPPVLVVDDIVGTDWKASRAAQDEVNRIGAAAVPPLLRARAATPAQASRRGPIDQALRAIVRALADEVGAPLDAAVEQVGAEAGLGGVAGALDRERPDVGVVPLGLDDLGDAGSISVQAPRDWAGRRSRARRARSALLALGPAVTGPLLEVPPLRTPVHTAVLEHVAGRIYAHEREVLLKEGEAALRARLAGLTDLAVPVVAFGLRDPLPAVRAAFQALRDEAIEGAVAALEDPSHDAREAAEATLLRLDALAGPALSRVARGEEPRHAIPQARAAAARLERRIRFGLGPELVRRLGDELDGYETLDFRARRARVIELERLGGTEAIPALRALLREEASDDIRAQAALGLFRQKDPIGAEWLLRNAGGIALTRLSPQELSAIHMDQGLSYLKLARFERAEKEFRAVVELEPENEVAWYNLACTYSRWGKLDLAFEHLRRAVAAGFDDVSHMEKDSDLDALRADPRYKEIIGGIEKARQGDGDPEKPEKPQ